MTGLPAEGSSHSPGAWHAQWSDETVALASAVAEESSPELFAHWLDAIDKKAMALFGVGSVILTFVPTIQQPSADVPKILWITATVAWALAAFSCFKAFAPTDMALTPSPAVLESEWLVLPPKEFRCHLLYFRGEAYEKNRAAVNAKAERLRFALLFTALEILFIASALIVS